MARYRGSECRLCRREGLKLFFKGDRCYTEKCAFERRGYAPGEHGQARKKHSDYGVQLREKQRLKRMYGLLEKQFRGYFERADRMKGITGSNLLVLLERRLDNVVFRLGFAPSRNEARQLVRHSHFLVNGRKVNIPSYTVRKDDVVELREKSRKVLPILDSLETVARRGIPGWLELDKDNFKGLVKAIPTREDITMPVQEQLVVELYSK
ncbi:MAG TPA: 30S ribosomal protein S4 [Syntrophales bacterium]|nr:30S ribosomal protein S4 [Syntrophobacterales bacterium]HNQ01324.1 30S ribosomal protein S4 [Syntrophales bacterium]HNS53635.1 30S ribosomal protein S4 [Syntrophales bacterium]HQL91032.1 30S ribosomal protein S4 [Syntrophales bacterium]